MNFNLNNGQKQAIRHGEGPCIVIAPPGSGKTAVITQRTKYLIEQQGINPANILVITFTKAAATQMKERFGTLMGGASPVSFGTFHAVFFTVLRHAYGFRAENILKEEQRIEFLRDIIHRFDLEIDDEMEFISDITGEISLIKNDRISLEHYYSTNCPEDVFRKIYLEYDNKLKNARLIDFDDMLVYCYELFKVRKDILNAWQSKYKYILIDEFQDINKIQYDIIRMLAKPNNNLFIVGDDDQSIYRFRGAKPEIMLNFDKDYKNAKKVLLNTNYRSTQLIVEGAVRVIHNNKSRFEKEVRTVQGEGTPIVIKTLKNQEEENKELINQILECRQSGGDFSDIAILYRTNTQPRILVEKLMEYNIPFKMRDILPNIYEHWITKNIISYIHLATGSRERKEFLQIINRPKRYVSRECLDNKQISFEYMREFYKDKDWMQERINKLEYDLRLLANMPPYAAINYIRQGIGYEEYLQEYAKYRRIKPDDLIDTLNEVQESAKSFKTFGEWFVHIDEYTNELKAQLKNRNCNHNSVSLATMHSAKGLEYKRVYIIDVNEGITPFRKAVTEADLAEERRMFYVALTRAKEQLYVYSLEERLGKKLEVSRFVGELIVNKQELVPSKEIIHKKYGEGVIKAVDKDKLIIYFKKNKKILVLDTNFCISNQYIKLKKEDSMLI
ncbi:DNA helicase-2/ATP-dependent DNA helicase PcrA [Lachnotalea glycerini]|uniref:DNA 3'-5' helicase n=1 Tax=Lachnotalea glycerini TaxID=1763509 RepID=A0A318F2Y8_9FIRM|nr:ATP-dependent helicase [Lachnotalea glycerini]PXV96238.1 DNA helicase-2/ATP-dependent DNA helicase PcrA [Lachnotalea glycerini]